MRELLICRCEEITEEEIRQDVRNGAHTITGVKRRTRAGMGLCQGHTCSKLIARIIAEETGKPLAEILPATVRPPVRPLAIKVLRSDSDSGDSSV
jgi:bacterioferritin-associated ferredoxin